MSELDELVACPGVLMAGRFGADGRVAEHKTTGLYIEIPALGFARPRPYQGPGLLVIFRRNHQVGAGRRQISPS